MHPMQQDPKDRDTQDQDLQQKQEAGAQAGSGQPVLVPQQGEIKNNDQDPGAGNRSLANEAGGKE